MGSVKLDLVNAKFEKIYLGILLIQGWHTENHAAGGIFPKNPSWIFRINGLPTLYALIKHSSDSNVPQN